MGNKKKGRDTGVTDTIKKMQAQIILRKFPQRYSEIWANVKTKRICLISWDAFGVGKDCTVIKSVPSGTARQWVEDTERIGRYFGAQVLHFTDMDFQEYHKVRSEERGCVCLN